MVWSWVLAGGSLLVVVLLVSKKSVRIKKIPSPGPHQYFLRDLKGPHVNGPLLSFFVALLESPFLGSFLTKLLFTSNHFNTLRNLQINAAPTYEPLVHDFDKDTTIDNVSNLSAEEFLQREQENLEKIATSYRGPFTTVHQYARAYKNKTTLPSVVAAKVVEAIKTNSRSKTPINAIISIIEDDVMQQARQSDARIQAGKPLSIFDGVPVTVKDEFDQKGLPTTCGTAYYKTVAVEDSTVALKMRERGAILIGKANMHEIGISTFGFNPHHGTPRNPYNLNHHTGGSSAGSAGAVGSNLVPMAVGADGGGSIRVPAALCGVVGLKPTFGRVGEHGCFPLCWTVAHAGPIGVTVRDCALGYAALAGVDPHDKNTVGQPPVILPNFDSLPSLPLKGLRVGVYTPWFEHATREVVTSARASIDILKSEGATVIEIPVLAGLLEYSRVAHTLIITTEMAAAISPYYENPITRSQFGKDARVVLRVTDQFKGVDYLQANRIRTLAIENLKEVFSKVDILITPTTATTAPRIATVDGKEDVDVTTLGLLMRFAFLGNFTGVPGITIPCGYTPEGLPIGFQVMGRWWEEHVLLKVAHVVEKHIERRTPQQLFKILA